MTAATLAAPELKEIRAARTRLAPFINRTPLLRLNLPGAGSGIFLKLENLQPIGVYKVRSMGNIMLSAGRDALRNGAYTASSGNAGLGLAWIANKLDICATIYAPESSPPEKLEAIRRFGARIRMLSDEDWWQIIVKSGHPADPGLYVDAVRDPAALAGNGTIGLEIAEQIPDVANVIIPFGGGGVACGIASALKRLKPGTQIMVAESDAAPPATAALEAGRPVEVDMKPSFISGAGAPRVLDEMWPLVRELIDGTVVRPVSEVMDAVRLLFECNRVVAEGAGAIPVAAALADDSLQGKTVCVVTGGNIDPDVMAKILRREY